MQAVRAPGRGLLARGLSSSVRERAQREAEARAVLERAVSPALAAVRSVSAGADGSVAVDLALRSGATPRRDALATGATEALRALPWVRGARCEFSLLPPRRASDAGPASLAAVSHVLGVSSCKGGVGKSTVALNLAFALARLGGRVGLLDADLYGPSLPAMVTLPEGARAAGRGIRGARVAPLRAKGRSPLAPRQQRAHLPCHRSCACFDPRQARCRSCAPPPPSCCSRRRWAASNS